MSRSRRAFVSRERGGEERDGQIEKDEENRASTLTIVFGRCPSSTHTGTRNRKKKWQTTAETTSNTLTHARVRTQRQAEKQKAFFSALFSDAEACAHGRANRRRGGGRREETSRRNEKECI